MLKTIKIRSYESGLYFRDGEFRGLLDAGRHWFLDPLGKVKVEVVSQRSPWLAHEKLDMIVKSGGLKDRVRPRPVRLVSHDHPAGAHAEGQLDHQRGALEPVGIARCEEYSDDPDDDCNSDADNDEGLVIHYTSTPLGSGSAILKSTMSGRAVTMSWTATTVTNPSMTPISAW